MTKLVRLDDRRTGLVVQLPTGLHVIDVVASVGVLQPEDLISNGLLNVILKDGGSWAPLIEHWQGARAGMRRLVQLASIAPNHPHLIMRPFEGIHVMPPSGNAKSIATPEIVEVNEISFDPTGREVIARQISDSPVKHVADDRVVALDAHRNAFR
jgi:hypothetical protein